MKRFERAIKVLNDEKFRITGKVAFNAVEKGHSPAYATRIMMVKNIMEAIEILEKHERNKNV